MSSEIQRSQNLLRFLSTAHMKDNQSTKDHMDCQEKDQGAESGHQVVEGSCIPSVELKFGKLALEPSGGVNARCPINDVSGAGGSNVYADHCAPWEPNEKSLRAKEIDEEPNITDLAGQVTGGNQSGEGKIKPRQKKKKNGNKSASRTSIGVVFASKQDPVQTVQSLQTGRSCDRGSDSVSTTNGEIHCKKLSTAGDSKKDAQGGSVGLNQKFPPTGGSHGSVLPSLQGPPVASIAAGRNNFHIDHQSSLRDADWEVVFSSCHQMSEQSQLNIHNLSHPAFSAWDQEAEPLITDGWDNVIEALADNAVEPIDGNGTYSEKNTYSPSDVGWETVTRSKGKAVRAQQQAEPERHTGGGTLLNGKMANQIKVVGIGSQSTVHPKFNGVKLGGTTVSAKPNGQARGNDRKPKQISTTCVSGNITKVHVRPDLHETEQQKQGISSYRHAADLTSLSGNDFLMPCTKVNPATVLQSLLPPARVKSSDEQHGCISGGHIGSIPSVKAADGAEYEAWDQSDDQYSDLDDMDDYSDDILSDDYASDASEQSHGTLKKWRCFQGFFQDLESLSTDQIQEHDRQWHCPVCQGGVGAVDWFRGFGPLIAHAQTMKSRRVKLHRIFRKVLEEELRQIGMGASVIDERPFGGKWHGLDVDDEAQNPLIVWPPMVIIQNTQLEMDDQEKWVGMGNKELLEYFKEYNPMRPRHAYGPQGHRGMSILMFAESPTGYHDAQRLDKHFRDARRGRDPWNNIGKLLYHPGGGGKRILYGYMASKADLDIFNRHHKGRTLLKFAVKQLQEVVLEPMHRMHDQDKKVLKLQSKVDREKEVCETLKKTVSTVCHNLVLREQELKVLRKRAEEQSIRNKEEQDELEEYFRVERDQLMVEVTEKEEELVKLREAFDQAHLQQCQKLELERLNIPKEGLSKDDQEQQQSLKEKEIARERDMVEGNLYDAKAFEAEREKMQQRHHELRLEFQRKQQAAALGFEQQLLDERANLVKIYQMKSLC